MIWAELLLLGCALLLGGLWMVQFSDREAVQGWGIILIVFSISGLGWLGAAGLFALAL